jgi:hypothetical protein
MRDQAENNSEIIEPQTPNAQSREQEPRYESESEDPQICRGID